MHPYSNLMKPLKIGTLTLKNRMLSSPTSQAGFDAAEHYTDEAIDYYRLKAAGGCSLVTVGDVIVDGSTGRSHPQQACIDDPELIPYLVKLAEAIHSGGAAASVQIDHGGSLCVPQFIGGKNPIGPSRQMSQWGFETEGMTIEQIESIAEAFGKAAKTVKFCGYDMVMIHCGHGWLLHQFLSPLTNKRNDEFGGSLENRLRFPLMVIDKVRQAVGNDFPIDVRISGSERVEGGYDIDTGIEIAKKLAEKVDFIHVSAGTNGDDYSRILTHPGMYQKHGENAYLAREIKKHIDIPICTVGAFSEPQKMEAFLAEGGADCIAMGRALIADPFLPKKVMRNKVEEINHCIRCSECLSGLMKNRRMHCTVNPIIGRECDFFNPIPVRKKRKVLIAGGGPGGMEAAITASEKGHEVVLCEASDRLGGALRFADHADFKADMKQYRDSQIAKVNSRPIKILLNTKVDKTIIAQEKPDVLIIAVGARAIMPSIQGLAEALGRGNVLLGADISDDKIVGDKVVIIGGGLIGCETGIHLGRLEYDTTVIEMGSELATDCGIMHRLNLLHQIEVCEKLKTFCEHMCIEVTERGVYAKRKDGKVELFEADTIVLAAGMIADTDAVDKLRELIPEYYVIGDAARAGKVGNATSDAYCAAINMGLF
ncbi:MAG: NAD(P)/FAD-dependent oxidoreductase [Bacillota bacterium]|nr:NAD(P)/FAD-dependent oxidoreductase [Bacillota bacterium]